MSTPTLLAILQKTTKWFEAKGIPNPRLDAELLLAHVLQLERMQIYLQFDRPMHDVDLAPLRPLIQRRGKREPLQHIIGTTGFRHLELKCNSHALIPRPETETLVDLGLDSLVAMCQTQEAAEGSAESKPLKIVDIGTGTGAIILSFMGELAETLVKAKRSKSAKINHEFTGIDISLKALELAQVNERLINEAKNSISEQSDEANSYESQSIHWIQSDSFNAVDKSEKFDLIISNPPYIPQADIAGLEPEVRDFDPHLALLGGESGLEIPQRIFLDAIAHVKSGSVLIFELGTGQVDELESWILSEKFDMQHTFDKFKDLNGLIRFAKISFS